MADPSNKLGGGSVYQTVKLYLWGTHWNIVKNKLLLHTEIWEHIYKIMYCAVSYRNG